MYVCPSNLHVGSVFDKFTNGAKVAAQNCNFKGCGAFTGEMAADQMPSMGIEWVLLGHSERRGEFGLPTPVESNALLATKLSYLLSKGLKCIFCVGEPREIREQGLDATIAECAKQLVEIKDMLDPATMVIAYEPVWAIGTGLVATPEQAQETHAGIRKWISENCKPGVAEAIRIQCAGPRHWGTAGERRRPRREALAPRAPSQRRTHSPGALAVGPRQVRRLGQREKRARPLGAARHRRLPRRRRLAQARVQGYRRGHRGRQVNLRTPAARAARWGGRGVVFWMLVGWGPWGRAAALRFEAHARAESQVSSLTKQNTPRSARAKMMIKVLRVVGLLAVAVQPAVALAVSPASAPPAVAPDQKSLLRAVVSLLPPGASASQSQLRQLCALHAPDLCGQSSRSLAGSWMRALTSVLGQPAPDGTFTLPEGAAGWVDPRPPPRLETRRLAPALLVDSMSDVETWLTNDDDEADRLVRDCFERAPYVGLDLEWAPTLVRGQRARVALLQLATDSHCLLLRLHAADDATTRALPPRLAQLLGAERPLKVGRGVAGDARLLCEQFGCDVRGAVELPGSESLKNLARRVGLTPPSSEARTDWGSRQLTGEAIAYAAFDAWASAAVWSQRGLLLPPPWPRW